MENIKKFSTEKQAVKYAIAKLGKYGYENCEVDGKPAMVSATTFPIEDRLRRPIEMAVDNFLTEVFGIEDDGITLTIGAEICEALMEKIEAYAEVKIISANLDF